MSILEFVATVVEALAWPIVLFATVIVLKRPLHNLIDRMRAVRTPNGSVEFGERLAEAESKVDNLLESPELQDSIDQVPQSDYDLPIDTAENSPDPSNTVLAAWERLHERLMKLHAATTPSSKPTRDVNRVLQDLRRVGLVNQYFVESVQALRDLRNSVAHATATPTEGSAATYRAQVSELIRAMDALEQVRIRLPKAQ
jgi:hypothetical protein